MDRTGGKLARRADIGNRLAPASVEHPEVEPSEPVAEEQSWPAMLPVVVVVMAPIIPSFAVPPPPALPAAPPEGPVVMVPPMPAIGTAVASPVPAVLELGIPASPVPVTVMTPLPRIRQRRKNDQDRQNRQGGPLDGVHLHPLRSG
jgi:hypothetical protein